VSKVALILPHQDWQDFPNGLPNFQPVLTYHSPRSKIQHTFCTFFLPLFSRPLFLLAMAQFFRQSIFDKKLCMPFFGSREKAFPIFFYCFAFAAQPVPKGEAAGPADGQGNNRA